MRGKDERKCSLALGRQGWRLGLLCSRKLSLRDNPFIQSIIEEDFYHQMVSFSATRIFLVQRGLHLLESHGSSYSCAKGGCFGFMACDSLSLLLALGKIDVSIGR